jgi:hypothetical protein
MEWGPQVAADPSRAAENAAWVQKRLGPSQRVAIDSAVLIVLAEGFLTGGWSQPLVKSEGCPI